MARERFERLPRAAAGGAKIAGRHDANPRLAWAEASDDDRFLPLLRRRFGDPDDRGDVRFSYSIRDNETGVEFEAYSGASGPAYGGSPPDHFIDFENNDNRTKPEVMAVLAAFEEWLVEEKRDA
jgi:hypothetical protein